MELCFIEKNRIQEFVLLGSEDTSTSSSDILSDLTGIESLDYLYSSFIDFKSFRIDTLLKKQASEDFDKKKNEIKELQVIKTNIIEKLDKYKKGKDTSKTLIGGLNNTKNYLDQRLNYYDELEKKSDFLFFSTQDKKQIEDNVESLKESYSKILEIRKYLADNLSDLQFSKLYRSIKELNENKDCDKTKCPACNTPIENVKTNPFENADTNLSKFEVIDQKQEELKGWLKKYNDNKIILLREINRISENVSNIKIYSLKEEFKNIEYNIGLLDLEKSEDKEYNLIIQIFTNDENDNYFDKLNFCITETTKKVKTKNAIKVIREKINRNIGDIESISKQVADLLEELKNNTKKYKKIDMVAVKQKLKDEEEVNNFLQKIKDGYDDLYKELTKFVKNKEEENFNNIKSDVIYFYNLINEHKQSDEKIEDLDLKLNEYQKGIIKIKLTNQKELVEATRILSEGHLRCLGLSLILAAIKRNQEVLLSV